jgi:pimeloyl-ACP methyl ester carboxylesterase
VLSAASRPFEPDAWSACGTTADAYATCAEIRKAKHEAMAEQSQRGIDCVIDGSGHHIQIDKPEVVIAAVRQAIALVTSSSQPSCSLL